MTRRLLLSYLGLTVLILLILEVPLAVLAQRFERQLATSQAEKSTAGLAALVGDSLGSTDRAQLQSIVTSYEARAGGEMVLISPRGQVLAASSADADGDSQDEWPTLTDRALSGQTSALYTNDEGTPYAVAATPVVENGRPVAAVVLGAPATLTQDRIHEMWLGLGLFAAAAIVVASAAGVVMARSLALPLGRLESTVDRFGRGDLGSRAVEQQGPAEVRTLAHRFNQMAAQLDDLIEAQRRFVADASHQLRSPLTALRLRLENLQATADGASQESIAAVGREAQRLSRLVDGLLAMSRAGQEVPTPIEVAVAEVAQARCDAWAPLAAEKGVLIESAVDLGPRFRRRVHPGDLEQILDNLLANSVEVSPPSSTIRLAACAGPHGVSELHVVDEGPGLNEEDRRRAFDRFWQGPARPTGNSGLGLAIARQLAQRNGMDVELRAGTPSGLDAVVILPPET